MKLMRQFMNLISNKKWMLMPKDIYIQVEEPAALITRFQQVNVEMLDLRPRLCILVGNWHLILV